MTYESVTFARISEADRTTVECVLLATLWHHVHEVGQAAAVGQHHVAC